MADTWERYFRGIPLTPGEMEAERERRRNIDSGLAERSKWRRASPATKMDLLQSEGMLTPVPQRRPGEVWGDVGRAVAAPVNATLSLLDTFGRGRDAAFRAAQEVSGPLVDLVEGAQEDGGPQRERKYNYSGALGHLASIPSNMVAPLTGAKVVGGYKEPDDWRQYATPGNALFLDMATDPGNYLPLPIGMARKGVTAAKAAGRYGSSLFDDAGGMAIRSLLEAGR